jgi:uncharacterized protein (TIGR03437 family)
LQAFVMERDGRILQVTRFAADATAAALSGDGRVVFASSQASELIRIEIDSGIIETIVVAAPYLDREQSGLGVPGSLTPFRGRGLANSTVTAGTPLPTALAGLRLRTEEGYRSIAKVAPDTVWVQVPWEFVESGHVVLETSELGIFEDRPPSFTLGRVGPRFLDGSQPGFPAISHEDLSRDVTPADPAIPGETIHFWMTGLGAVDRVVATGEASPADPPSRIVSPLACEFAARSGRVQAAVSFAGLAPGQVGVYQLTVAVPAEAANRVGRGTNFFCTLERLSLFARVPIERPPM